MYYLVTDRSVIEFENWRQLINFLVGANHRSLWDGTAILNDYMTRLGNNDKDTFRSYDVALCPRTYRVYDEYGRSLYNHELIRAVHTTSYSEQTYKEWRAFVNRDNPKLHKIRWRWTTEIPRYRIDPVPFTGHGNHHSHYYRTIHHIRDKKLAERDKDTGTVRAARNVNNLPEPWDDEPHRDWGNRGWKRQGKYRHQWERKALK